jgi:hypothetical protein
VNLQCLCGLPATLAADVTRPNCATLERRILCSVTCATVREPGTVVDVVVEPNDFARVMKARPCWCHMRHFGLVPWCPDHGTTVINPKE